jgi:pyruvate formate lyase activating enzyme
MICKIGSDDVQTALIFNIQKFSVHDGPGIRTTIFFKGCPLACQWCHNPESQSYRTEIMVNPDRCTQCGQCEQHCPEQAITWRDDNLVYDRGRCKVCGACIDYCCNNAREVVGKDYTVPELMIEIEKDRSFYEHSGGGVTLSGGEAMMQIDFVEQLIKACKDSGISVVIDTCGYAPSENFLRIVNNVDLFLYDIKLMDPDLHVRYTGQDNVLILKNLQLLSDQGAKIDLRLPLIEGVNTSDEEIQSVIDFASHLHIDSIHLLPYHDIAKGKYHKLDVKYSGENFLIPSAERLQAIAAMFKNEHYQIMIGG